MKEYSQDNENDPNYKMTGNMVKIPQDHFVKFVFQAMQEFKEKLLAGDPNPVPNPLSESLFITNGDKTIMIPHDTQNDAITLYLREDPQLKSMIGVTDALESESESGGRQPLINSKAFEVGTDEDTDEQIDELDSSDEGEVESSSTNTMAIAFCIIIALALIYLFGHKLKME